MEEDKEELKAVSQAENLEPAGVEGISDIVVERGQS